MLRRMLSIFIAVTAIILSPSPVFSQYYGSHFHDYQQYAIGIPIWAEYYYSVGHEEDEQAAEQRIIDGVIRKFEEKFQIGEGGEEAVAIDKSSFKLFGPPVKGSLEQQVLAILDKKCVDCHKPGAAKPGVYLFTKERKLYADSDPSKELVRRQRILAAIEDGSMPMDAPSLPKAEQELIKKWVSLAEGDEK